MKLAILVLLLLAGCNNDTFAKYIQLGGLRVLAIKADNGGNAEFSPGDTVTLTPFVSDYRGGGRALTYQASACVDPGISYGASPSCGSSGVAVGSGAVTMTGAITNTGAANTFTVTIPSDILSSHNAVDQYNGVNYLVVYTISAADGTSVASFKRLPVSSASKTKNKNPTLTDVLINGATFTSFPAAQVALSASYPAAAIESYTSLKNDGTPVTMTEQLVTTFFITDGSLDTYRVVNDQSANYTPPAAAPSDHSAIIVGVIRDGRGGEDAHILKLN